MTPRSKLLAAEIRHSFTEEVTKPAGEIRLEHASLLIAAEDQSHERVDVESCLAQLESWGELAHERIWSDSFQTPIEAFNHLVFEELGFKGNQLDYYDPRNSYLDQVIRRRTGIPITLSLIYLSVGRRAGLDVEGVGLPGHFLVRVGEPGSLASNLVDPFYGKAVEREDCQERLDEIYDGQVALNEEHLRSARPREILIRLLTNLKNIYARSNLYLRALASVERILILKPGEPFEHRDRGLILSQLNRLQEAVAELQVFLQLAPPGTDTEQVRGQLKALQGRIAQLN